MAISETFLSAFLQVLFEQLLRTGGKQFLKMVGGVDLPKTIKKWEEQLTRLEALLEDAEQQQFHNKYVKLWLNELQDLAYDIEDLLDHFAIEAQRYNKLKKAEEDQVNALHDHSNVGILYNMVQTIRASGSRAANSLSTLLKPIDQDIQDKIDDITERLQDIQDQTHSLSLTAAHMLRQQTLQTETIRRQRESTSLVCEVFGRGDKKQEIITRLLKDEQSSENYVVIPIVGTGGIGKTTLAQYVYNDEQLKGYFHPKAWVCVSDVFDVKRVTIDIINSATQDNFDCSNLDQAQLKLQKVLNNNKFLIVLDDIWSEEYDDWSMLQRPFQHGAKGSRVIMTTRTERIAMMMVNNPTQPNIKLKSLSNDDCWLIFQQHAKVDSDLTEMRDKIIEKIDGLPLAAKALGGLLKSIPDKSQRRKILESNVWGEKSSVLPVLWLSYHHMPSHLKRVFAYCSVFPKDYRFKEMEVVLLWMAQGFLPDNTNERMEDIGHGYFNDLVSRSLFEKSPSCEGMFIMHDLIHNVAQFAAGEVCYVADADRQINGKRIRHLFITKHVQTLGSEIMVPQLRTFLCKNDLKFEFSDLFKKIRYIRTLIICSCVIEVLPECVGDLKHLCYLSLNFQRLKVLPQSISKLWNLQTLCLKGCYKLEKVPCIESLGKLRHLYNYSTILRLTSLKEMPLGIGKLTNLQTLDRFVLAAGGGSRVRELGKLNHLRGSLSISSLENVIEIEDAQEAQLCKKESLDRLYLAWGTCTDEVDDKTMRDVVEKLKPHTSIKECELSGYMGLTFPNWLGDLSYNDMVYIGLVKCKKCEWLPPLGNLPSLKSLRIEYMNGIKEVGLEFYGHCSTPFPSLETLRLSGLKSWEKWVHPPVDNNKAFPILENLSITGCVSLQGDLPPHLPSLRRLETNQCRLQSLELKNSSSSTSRLEKLVVKNGEPMVSIGNIPLTLQSLVIDGCKKLGYVEFDEQPPNLSAGSEESVGVSPKASLELPLLTELKIERCPSLLSLQQSLILPALQNLHLKDCENMERLPGELHNITSLQELWIEKCPKIHSLAEGGLPRNLTSLAIEEVNISQAIPIIECIPCPHLSLPSSLSTLYITGFQNLKSISNGTTLPNLTRLYVGDCPRLESLFSNFNSLTKLSIENCPELLNFPRGGLPTNLRRLSIRGTNIDNPIEEWGLHLLTSLEDLRLENVGSCVDTLESISYPDFPSSLSELHIKGFQNLKTICCSTLPNLYSMVIKYCPKLETFGDTGLPPHIIFVVIEECAMIGQQLTSNPHRRIRRKNRILSLPLSGSQPSSAHSST